MGLLLLMPTQYLKWKLEMEEFIILVLRYNKKVMLGGKCETVET